MRHGRPSRIHGHRMPTGAALAALALAGCAGAVHLPEIPPPSEIPALEAQVSATDPDPSALVRLGAAYVAADRPGEAVQVLERARGLVPGQPDAVFFLGSAYAAAGRPSDAVAAYRAFATALPSGPARDHVEARIRLLRREELRMAVRQAIETEGDLRGLAPPDRSAVAVFPFAFASPDESLRPLARAMSAMLATDLSQSSRVRVLERQNVQALIAETDLGETDLIDPATAARGGYLIGAGRIIQGRIAGPPQRIEVDAAVVDVGDAVSGGAPVALADDLDGFFALQTQLALDVFESLGIALTDAERAAVTRRPTRSLQALLAFGQGLEAEDAGRYGEAARYFDDAARMDPGFREARSRAVSAGAEAEASQGSVADDAAIVDAALQDLGVDAVLERAGARDPVQEALGGEGLGRDLARRIRLVFPLPGSGG